MSFYQNKDVLVAGGTGLIGRPLVEMLLAAGARVRIASLDDPSRAPQGVEFRQTDLRDFSACLDVCRDMEIVFNLTGVKGSPAMTAQRPASFFVPTITFSLNLMEAARRMNVERYLFTSSVGVYAPANVFHEDTVWSTFPSPHDRFAGWAKRMGELQAEAYRIEYGWDKISIVRPANVYGPYDNFDLDNAMVIPSLIRRVIDGERPLTVWGDGTPVRDFIHARDVARGMMTILEKGFSEPVNLGSGIGFTIREVAEIIARFAPEPLELRWDTSKPMGDTRRILDTARATALGITPQISLEEGIADTIKWYQANHADLARRYNTFTDPIYLPDHARDLQR
ncbi:MAG: NAD-dependent epimerase/dehydratase family protein [Rhodospirillaceae bacterium]|nr:NAD-dependent epimerase/dehydratase family protein [Rhodospirillaceae bacterium]